MNDFNYGISDDNTKNLDSFIDIVKDSANEQKVKKSLKLMKQQSESIIDEANKIIEICDIYEYKNISGVNDEKYDSSK